MHACRSTLEDPTGIEGDAANDARTALTHQLGAIEACYRDTLKRSPKLQGTFTITVYAGTDGTLSRAAIKGAKPADKALATCMVKTVNSTKLDHGPAKKPIKLTIALAFKAP